MYTIPYIEEYKKGERPNLETQFLRCQKGSDDPVFLASVPSVEAEHRPMCMSHYRTKCFQFCGLSVCDMLNEKLNI